MGKLVQRAVRLRRRHAVAAASAEASSRPVAGSGVCAVGGLVGEGLPPPGLVGFRSPVPGGFPPSLPVGIAANGPSSSSSSSPEPIKSSGGGVEAAAGKSVEGGKVPDDGME